MTIIGDSILQALANQKQHSAKMIFNEHGAIFFPVHQEHCDQKIEGISYEDNYKGNALAAMLRPNMIDIRFHKSFSDSRVLSILRQLFSHPACHFMYQWQVEYQGRPIRPSEF